MVAGVQIAVSQPIRIGDRISFEEVEGRVTDITLSYTYVDPGDGSSVVIPNQLLVEGDRPQPLDRRHAGLSSAPARSTLCSMTQRNRRRQRRRGGIGSKLLFLLGGILAAARDRASIGVTSWVLDVAADAPSLASCKPIDKGGNSALYAADGTKLGVIASNEARTRSRSSGSRKACSWRRWRSRTSASTSTAASTTRGSSAPRSGPRSRRSGRGRLDDHPAAGPQPLHPQPGADPRAQDHRGQARGRVFRPPQRTEILGPYLNIASYGTVEGSTAVGVEAASRIYFAGRSGS